MQEVQWSFTALHSASTSIPSQACSLGLSPSRFYLDHQVLEYQVASRSAYSFS